MKRCVYFSRDGGSLTCYCGIITGVDKVIDESDCGECESFEENDE